MSPFGCPTSPSNHPILNLIHLILHPRLQICTSSFPTKMNGIPVTQARNQLPHHQLPTTSPSILSFLGPLHPSQPEDASPLSPRSPHWRPGYLSQPHWVILNAVQANFPKHRSGWVCPRWKSLLPPPLSWGWSQTPLWGINAFTSFLVSLKSHTTMTATPTHMLQLF